MAVTPSYRRWFGRSEPVIDEVSQALSRGQHSHPSFVVVQGVAHSQQQVVKVVNISFGLL
jgi:pyruvate-formate lyase-activating enzyme